MKLTEKCSALSGVSIKALNKMKQYINMIHSDDVYLDSSEGRQIIDIETFEGTIKIKIEDNEIKYKFIPNDEFNKMIVRTVADKSSQLVKHLDKSVINAMSNIYENII